MPLPARLGDLPAVDLTRQTNVGKQKVRHIILAVSQCLLAVRCPQDVKSGVLQSADCDLSDQVLVLNN